MRARGWIGAAMALGAVACTKGMPTDCKTEGTALVRQLRKPFVGADTTPNQCVDVHAASRRDATAQAPGLDESFAMTQVGVIPWTNVTYEGAALACGRAGRFLCNRETLELLGGASQTGLSVAWMPDVGEISALAPTTDVLDMPDQPAGAANPLDPSSTLVVYPETLGLSYWTDDGKIFGQLTDSTSKNGGKGLSDSSPQGADYKHPLLGFRCCYDGRYEGVFSRLAPDPSKIRASVEPVPIAGAAGSAGGGGAGGGGAGGGGAGGGGAGGGSAGGGVVGHSLHLGPIAAGDYATADDTGMPAQAAPRTVELWIRTTQAREQYAVSWGGTGSAHSYLVGVFDGKAVITQNGDSVQSVSPIADGTWHHIAATFDGSMQMIYFDGRPEAGKALTIATTTGGAGALVLGGSTLNASYKVEGDLAEVRIWDRARSSREIEGDYRMSLSGTEPGLLVYWDMNASGMGPGVTIPNRVAPGGARDAVTRSTRADLPTFPASGPF